MSKDKDKDLDRRLGALEHARSTDNASLKSCYACGHLVRKSDKLSVEHQVEVQYYKCDPEWQTQDVYFYGKSCMPGYTIGRYPKDGSDLEYFQGETIGDSSITRLVKVAVEK